jgi:hypothetical protein
MLKAKIGVATLDSETISAAGTHEYRREVPAGALGSGMVEVEFALDRYLKPEQADGRELGIVVTSVGLEPK